MGHPAWPLQAGSCTGLDLRALLQQAGLMAEAAQAPGGGAGKAASGGGARSGATGVTQKGFQFLLQVTVRSRRGAGVHGNAAMLCRCVCLPGCMYAPVHMHVFLGVKGGLQAGLAV